MGRVNSRRTHATISGNTNKEKETKDAPASYHSKVWTGWRDNERALCDKDFIRKHRPCLHESFPFYAVFKSHFLGKISCKILKIQDIEYQDIYWIVGHPYKRCSASSAHPRESQFLEKVPVLDRRTIIDVLLWVVMYRLGFKWKKRNFTWIERAKKENWFETNSGWSWTSSIFGSCFSFVGVRLATSLRDDQFFDQWGG